MPYTFREHLTKLNEFLVSFDKTNKCAPFSVDDEKAYQAQRLYLNKLLELGLKLENTSAFFHPKTKMELGRQMKTLVKTIINTKDNVPAIAGDLSYEFASLVYLPHLKLGDQVEFPPIEKSLASLINSDIEKEKADSRTISNLLEKKLEKHKTTVDIPSKGLAC